MFKRLLVGEETTVEVPLDPAAAEFIGAMGGSPDVLRAGLLLGEVACAISGALPEGSLINGLQSVKFTGALDLEGPSPFVALEVERIEWGVHLGFRVLQSGEELVSGTAIVQPPERY